MSARSSLGLSRRSLLALGAGSVLAAVAGERRAGAAPASKLSGRPLRFIAVYTPHGRAHELWQPRDSFDISYPESTLAPFDDAAHYGKSFKDKLLVLDGVDLSAGIAVGTSGHDGPRVILTGSGADGKNASLDQFLAVERGFGAETPHSSLVFAVGNDGTEIGNNISYASGGTPLPKWIDPSHAFDVLFGAALGSPEELARQRKLGKSVLDAVSADLASLAARAPASERSKLEQHHVALRELEKRISAVPKQCAPPARPDAARFPRLKSYGGGERYFDTITDLQIDLLARAMACDLTRFSTLFLADLSRTKYDPELPDDVHTEVAHLYDAQTDKRAGTPKTWHTLGIQNRYSYGKVARLLQRLDEAGILDDTIVYVSGDMGDPNRHSSRGVPTLIAGGTGGHFKLGRYLDLRGRAGGGVPNNRLLVSVCQAFGLAETRFGHASEASIVNGRLDDVFAT
ncbi:MAG TPA: DUF1552 domain-containing protein [Polyangiaceae bacterium]|jgi:hypothetical protein